MLILRTQDITKWVVLSDESIEADLGQTSNNTRTGVEIVSRVFNDPPPPDWRLEVEAVVEALKANGVQVWVNPSTGLHVHVGLSVKRKKWPLNVLKRIATIILLYEGTLLFIFRRRWYA